MTDTNAPSRSVRRKRADTVPKAAEGRVPPARTTVPFQMIERPTAMLRIYDSAPVESWRSDLLGGERNAHDPLVSLARRLPRGPLMRPYAAALTAAAVDDLYRRFPNFAAPLDFIAGMSALSRLGDGQRQPPILLAGPPGVGKTSFARAVAEAMGMPFRCADLSAATAGFYFCGVAAGYATARTGQIFRALVDGAWANPVFLLDELDKVNRDTTHNPEAALYTLLEPSTACAFVDEAVSFPIDASGVIYMATANDLSRVPLPLVSRFRVFELEAMTEAQVMSVVAGVWAELCRSMPWGHAFPSAIDDEVVCALAGAGSARGVRVALHEAASRAALAGRTRVEARDVVLVEAIGPAGRSIGFV